MKKAISILFIFSFFSLNFGFGQNCETGTDDPPGCFLQCRTWSALDKPFSPDMISSTNNCLIGGRSRWFRVVSSSNRISISMNQFNCSPGIDICVRVFRENLVPVSTVQTFNSNDFSSVLTTTTVLLNRTYLVRVESTEPIGCDFELAVEGIRVPNIVVSKEIEISGDSIEIFGTAQIDSVVNASEYLWFSSDPELVISSGQGTSLVQYSKPRFSASEICVTPNSECQTGITKCLTIPVGNSFCTTGSESFPGCSLNCDSWWALDEPFYDDPNFGSYCNAGVYTKWFEVTAGESEIEVRMDRFNCIPSARVDVALFDENMGQLIPSCEIFTAQNFSPIYTVQDLIIGEKYSLMVETNRPTGCDFQIKLNGIEYFQLEPTPDIDVTYRVPTGFAEIAPVIGASDYIWEIENTQIEITNGQGTPNLEFLNTQLSASEICVTPIGQCGPGQKKCATIDSLNIPNCANVQGGAIATDFPTNSCFLCSPVYSGSTEGFTNSNIGACVLIQNDQWIRIIAGTTGSINAVLVPSSCQNGDGLDLMIYDENLNELDCDSGPGGLVIPLTVNASVSESQVLYIRIDGWNTDICDFVLTLTGAVQIMSNPISPITMTPDKVLCPGNEVRFEINSNNGNLLEWTIPTNLTIIEGGEQDDLFVRCRVNSEGTETVKVVPYNFCNASPAQTKQVVAVGVPPAVWPPIFVCQNDMPWDITILGDRYQFDQYGSNEIVIPTTSGCDSIIKFALIPKVQTPTLIDTTICEGDCVLVGGDCYDNVGATTIVLVDPMYRQQNGCDSMVNLVLRKLNPIAKIVDPGDLPCVPGATVPLDGTGSSSGAAFTYNWTATNGGTFASSTNTNVSAAGSPGTYILAVSETSMDGSIQCVALDTVEVWQQVQILNDPTFIAPAFTNVCLGETYTYSIGPVSGAIDYIWTAPLGATILDNGTSALVSFNSVTSGRVCVKAIGTCGESMNVCLPVTINPIPTADFTVTTPICIVRNSRIQYSGTASPFANYTWSFNGGVPASVIGGGPHNISWGIAGPKTITLLVEENGCLSSQNTQVVQVDPELATPVINCDATPTTITFNWGAVTGAFDYSISINGGALIRQPGTTFAVTGLNSGDDVTITVVANSISACPSSMSTQTCTAQGCPTVTIDISPVAPICRDASTSAINLTATQSGGVGGGIFTFSGNGVTNNGIFDPQMAAIGTNLITVEYVEGICSYTTSINVEVNETPTSSFDATTIICQTDLAMFGYSGTATNNANFNWDFGSGAIVNGSNAGPYEVAFANAGVETVSLEVEENGCVSNISTQTIEVQEQLIPSIIRCSSTVNSVMFNWDLVPNATNYQIDILTGQTGVFDINNVLIDNLNPGEVVEIEVTAESNNACGNITMLGSCIAQDCPMVSVDVEPVTDICLTSATQPIQLNATAGNNSGTFTFSGNGVSNSGVFDPQMAGIGMNRITVEYVDGSCSYSGSTTILINETPTASFDVTTPICQTEMATISYTGTANNNASFNWNFGNGTVATGSNSGPYEVSFGGVGVETISLLVEENGCNSSLESKTIQIDQALQPIVISCTPGIDEVIFELSADPNVLNYRVQFFGGQIATLSGTTYTVSGLLPGEEVTIEVEGISANSCPSTGIERESCTALDCPSIVLAIAPILDPICEGDSTIIQLNVTNNSPTQNGNYTWSGTNVSADGKFNSAGLPAGEYIVEIAYDEMNCTYQSSQIIRIEPLPEINATINSPIWSLGGTGRIELEITNSFPPYTISNGPIVYSTNGVLDSLPPGEYCVSANSPFGCFAKECFTVSEGIYNIKPIHVICAGDNQPLSVSPGTGATFSWSPSFRLSCDDCSNPIANPGRTTTYTVTATLPNGQSASQNVVVIVLPSIICNSLPQDDDRDFAKLLSDIDFQKIKEKELIEIENRITNFYSEKEVEIAPNPTNGMVNILTPEKVASVEVFDFSGKQILTAFEKEIDLSKMAKGVYFLRIMVQNQIVVKRVLLK